MRYVKQSTASIFLVLACACTSEVSEIPPELGQTREPLYYEADAVWGFKTISVCWTSSDNATERGWVRNAVEAAFEPLSDINFTGWDECGFADVVIDVSSDYWPHAALGQQFPFTPSVFLNHFIGKARDLNDKGKVDFEDCYTKLANGEPNPVSSAPYTGKTGRSWSSVRRNCIESIAVHEFAHVLGIAHEQNRPDNPASCDEEDDGTGDTEYGYWDLTSISNYCNPAWNGDGRLSPLDVSWLMHFYGKQSNDQLWTSIGDAQDYGSVPQHQMMFEIESEDVSGDYAPQVGDFNGDGRSDILWYRDGTGSDPIWWGRSQGGFTHDTASKIDSTYRMATADFDGDGRTDIFMHASGSVNDRVWFGRADKTFTDLVMPDLTGTFVPIAGDFDGDGFGDVFLYAEGDRMEHVWWGRADRSFTRAEAQENVTGSYVPLAGDFDGDGRWDIFWYDPGGSGDERIWWGRSNRTFDKTDSTPNVTGTFSATVGDFDGNGVSDILWSDGSSSARDPLWLFKKTRGSFSDTRVSSILSSKPFSGDFNGDGLDDVFFYKAD